MGECVSESVSERTGMIGWIVRFVALHDSDRKAVNLKQPDNWLQDVVSLCATWGMPVLVTLDCFRSCLVEFGCYV